jgi:hypothetical protein
MFLNTGGLVTVIWSGTWSCVWLTVAMVAWVQLFDPMGIHHVLFLSWQSKHPPLTPVLPITYMIIVFKLVLLIHLTISHICLH